jgi:hypothetical protein
MVDPLGADFDSVIFSLGHPTLLDHVVPAQRMSSFLGAKQKSLRVAAVHEEPANSIVFLP